MICTEQILGYSQIISNEFAGVPVGLGPRSTSPRGRGSDEDQVEVQVEQKLETARRLYRSFKWLRGSPIWIHKHRLGSEVHRDYSK